MGGGDTPEDKSAEVAAIEAQTARDAQAAADAKAAQEEAEFMANLDAAYSSGLMSANDYFIAQGLDPAQYSSEIQNMANQIKTSVPQGAADPGSYFASLGDTVYDQLTSGLQNKSVRTLNEIAPVGFSEDRITSTSDDEIIAAIVAEQEATAKEYIDNLLGRGVITDSGYASALKSLLGQTSGASSTMQELGMGILEGGRSEAENMANDAKSYASQLLLGTSYDPYELGTDLNDFFAEFYTGLGDDIRGITPTSLFDTSGLANIAGAAQGAGNYAFDPRAVAGVFDDEEEEEEEAVSTNPF